MHTLRSRFWTRSYFQAVLLLLTLAMMAALLYYANGQFLLLGLVPLLGLVCLWLLHELRNKAIKIVIDDHSLYVTGFYGFGNTREHAITGISGFKTASLSTENGNFEYLYLFAGEKRIACISGYHHRNYGEIKTRVHELFKNLGSGSFSMAAELKELFR